MNPERLVAEAIEELDASTQLIITEIEKGRRNLFELQSDLHAIGLSLGVKEIQERRDKARDIIRAEVLGE